MNELRPLGLKTIGITTNGIGLKNRLEDMKHFGLDQVNISLDTLDKHQFELLTRRRGHASVLDSIDRAVDLGFEQVKVNAVIMNRINRDQIIPFIEFSRERRVRVRFIEYMPFSGNTWKNEKFVSYADMLSLIKEKYPAVIRLQDGPNDTTKVFTHFLNLKNYTVDGFKGSFGFISSMSDHFCSTCNRLRLMADGNLKVFTCICSA